MICSCASGFAVKESRKVSQDFLGISPHSYYFTENGKQLLDDLGIVWLRRDAGWNSLEPVQGEWNFSDLDKNIENDLQNGKKLIIILDYDTPWIYADNKNHKNITAKELPHYLNFVKTIVMRYKGKVAAWEIWNEPNGVFWKGSEKDFFELTKNTARLIRELDPESKIIIGALSWVPAGLVKRMLKSGAAENADAFSFHPYDLNPRRVVALADKMEKIAASCNFEGELWVTETGYPTAGWYPHKASEKRFPEYIIKTLAGFAVRPVRVAAWYELFNSYNKGKEKSKLNSEDYFGLVYPDYSRKDGAAAFALCGKYIQGRTYLPDPAQKKNAGGSIESMIFKDDNGNNTLILWNNALGAKKLNVTLQGTNIKQHNIATGEALPLHETLEINIDRTPVFITWDGEAAGVILSR
ncbi:hypothetical protein AGMMS50212_01080 [Spirochaetia bacterium]|nr:hypothetical protein AGMMS50212_01080 [Spirochaetia bacterium]